MYLDNEGRRAAIDVNDRWAASTAVVSSEKYVNLMGWFVSHKIAEKNVIVLRMSQEISRRHVTAPVWYPAFTYPLPGTAV